MINKLWDQIRVKFSDQQKTLKDVIKNLHETRIFCHEGPSNLNGEVLMWLRRQEVRQYLDHSCSPSSEDGARTHGIGPSTRHLSANEVKLETSVFVPSTSWTGRRPPLFSAASSPLSPLSSDYKPRSPAH